MRTLVILGSVLILFIASGLYVQHYLNSTGQALASDVQTTMDAAKAGNWSLAQDQTGALIKSWDKIGPRWGFFTEHQEIDDINATMSRLRAYVDEKDTASTLAEAEAALHLFKHIPEKESLKLENIL